MLKVENLESGYGPMQVLWQPSLEVKKGSITSLLGPNGVGKSTLLRTVLGSVQPWAGKITYEGMEITQQPTRSGHYPGTGGKTSLCGHDRSRKPNHGGLS